MTPFLLDINSISDDVFYVGPQSVSAGLECVFGEIQCNDSSVVVVSDLIQSLDDSSVDPAPNTDDDSNAVVDLPDSESEWTDYSDENGSVNGSGSNYSVYSDDYDDDDVVVDSEDDLELSVESFELNDSVS